MAAQGDPGARTRVLRARLRAGELDAGSLRLASYLGCGAEDGAWDEDLTKAPLDGWIRGLAAWGKPALLRAGAGVLRAGLQARSGLPDRPQDATLKALARVEDALRGASREDPWWVQEELQAVAVLADGVDQDLAWMANELLSAVSADDSRRACDHVREVVRLSERLLSDQATRHAIREALLPWVLGDR